MIVCESCGHANADDASFCTCGAYLPWEGRRGSAVDASISEAALAVEPGREVGCEVSLRNDGRIVDDFSLRVTGAAREWATVTPPSLQLFPSRSGQARIVFKPPRSSQVRAGPVSFALEVGSRVDPSVTRTLDGSVTVGGFLDLSDSRLTPQTSEGIDATEHRVEI